MRVPRNCLPFALTAILAVTAELSRGTPMYAVAACTAADIMRLDSGCGSVGLCQITESFDVLENACTFDFGTRSVLFNRGGRLVSGRRMVTIKAANLGFANGGSIDGTGTRNAPNDVGGVVRLEVTGNVTFQGTTSGIDVSGASSAGAIIIDAGGSVTADGKLIASGARGTASGGTISIRAGGDFSSSTEIEAKGREESAGGTFDVLAGGRIAVGGRVNVSGSEGGIIDILGGGEVILGVLNGEGAGEGGSGGCMTAVAGTRLEALDLIDFDGSRSAGAFGGGCGGFVCLESSFGELIVRKKISAEGAIPDGGGGSIALIGVGGVNLPPNSALSVRGNGGQGCGGEICVDSTVGNVDAFGLPDLPVMDASGGCAGGDVDLTAHRNIVVAGDVDVRGRTVGGFAGSALIEAGFAATGNLTLSGAIDAGAGACSPEQGCGVGGVAQLIGCDVQVVAAGSVSGRAPEGGITEVVAREQLTIRGAIDMTTTGGPQPVNGSTLVMHPSRKQPIIIANQVNPGPTLLGLDTCTMPRQEDCVIPCPACGNGLVEFPETCDNAAGPPLSCDGCSASCREEDCNDNLMCTVDSCAPTLGCRHVPRLPRGTPCFEPGELTPTPTPSATRPSASLTATPTRSASPTASLTATGGPSPTVTPMATMTPTAADTPTPTTAASSTPTISSCVGDCGGNNTVTIDELVRGVNMVLELAPVSQCPSFDANRDGHVMINELVDAVNNVLDGCDE